jgi:hypothetical protein
MRLYGGTGHGVCFSTRQALSPGGALLRLGVGDLEADALTDFFRWYYRFRRSCGIGTVAMGNVLGVSAQVNE